MVGAFTQLRHRSVEKVDLQVIRHKHGVDEDVSEFMSYCCLFGGRQLLGPRLPLEVFQKLRRLDADRSGEVLRGMELFQVALSAKREESTLYR